MLIPDISSMSLGSLATREVSVPWVFSSWSKKDSFWKRMASKYSFRYAAETCYPALEDGTETVRGPRSGGGGGNSRRRRG